jgi:hypothetical protein
MTERGTYRTFAITGHPLSRTGLVEAVTGCPETSTSHSETSTGYSETSTGHSKIFNSSKLFTIKIKELCKITSLVRIPNW